MGTVAGPDLVWVLANDAYRKVSGRADLIGRPLREVFPEFEGQGVFELVQQVRTSGRPVTAHNFRLHIEIDGVQEERSYDFSWFPSSELGADGAALYVDILVVDVTERAAEQRRAERAARDAELRYATARAVVSEIQESLLPADLPVLPAVDLAASYLLAGEEQSAGGDWFDAVVRPDGRVALVVGDVIGHGVLAAAVMGQLRAVLHERLLSVDPLVEVLTALDGFARATAGATGTSVCVVVLDPQDGSVEYCTAGHPPPLVVRTDGQAAFLEVTGARLLGAGDGFPTGRTRLGTDDVVLLYSDGLVERPGRTVTDSVVEVHQFVSQATNGRAFPLDPQIRTVERMTRQALEMLTRVSGYRDDITLLAAQRTLRITPYRTVLPAVPDTVRQVREELAAWLDAMGAGALSVTAVQHVVAELVSNAVVHAYADGVADATTSDGHDVRIEAEIESTGTLRASVRDAGRWREPSDTPGGRGLLLARQLADRLRIERGDAGTVVHAEVRVTREAAVLHEATSVARVAPDPAEVPFSVVHDELGLRVAGPVDLVSALDLQVAVLRAGWGGARALRIDLSQVTHLGSVGVRVLSAASGDEAPNVTLVAPLGSVAQHVLDLVHLPYRTDLTPPG